MIKKGEKFEIILGFVLGILAEVFGS